MPTKSSRTQIGFRYRAFDSANGVTRQTAQRLADALGVDETQVIHTALAALAVKMLPLYEADEGPLSGAQMHQLRKHIPQGKQRAVRSSLIETVPRHDH